MEIIMPGSDSAHGARNVWELKLESPKPSDSILVPTGDRHVREAQLIDATITELGLDGLEGWVDPTTHEYEILAPTGHEFVMRGKFRVWGADFGPPELSEELLAVERCEENPEDGWHDDDEKMSTVSEFRGPRISLELNHRNIDFSRSMSENPWQRHKARQSGDGDRPHVQIKVKAQMDVSVFVGRLIKLPFNLDGLPEPMDVPTPEHYIQYRTCEAEGLHGSISIELVGCDTPETIVIPRSVAYTDTDDFWLPRVGFEKTFEEFKQASPEIVDYMAWKLGGGDQAVIDYHRRIYGMPFADDPLARAHCLMSGFYSIENLDTDVAGIISRMSEGEIKNKTQKIFRAAAANPGLNEAAKTTKREMFLTESGDDQF